jgi:hypothetical protein
MHVCVRYSQNHARAQELKKAEHETGKKRAPKLCQLTVIRKMRADLSRTVWMKFPNQLNENVVPNIFWLLTLA